jgi:MFS family permease
MTAAPFSTPSTSPTSVRPRLDPRLRGWRNALLVTFAASGLFMATWAARIPAVSAALHLSTAAVGQLLFCIAVGSMFGLTLAPTIQARLGSRRGIAWCVVTVALCLILAAVGADVLYALPLICVALAVLGFSFGALDVIMNISAAACEKRVGRTILPLMHASYSLGTAAGAGIGAAAAALDIPVFWHFTVMSVLAAGCSVVLVRRISNAVSDNDDTGAVGIRHRRSFRQTVVSQLRVWADARLILIGLVMLGMAFAEGSANDWLALASVKGHGLDDAAGALMLTVFVIAMTGGRTLGGLVVDRLGRVWTIRLTAALAITGMLLFILGQAPWMYVVGVAVWGLGASLGFPLGISAASDDEKNAAARVSVVSTMGYLAFLVGPPAIGFVGEHIGLLNAFFLVVALLVVALFCAPALRPPASAASDHVKSVTAE